MASAVPNGIPQPSDGPSASIEMGGLRPFRVAEGSDTRTDGAMKLISAGGRSFCTSDVVGSLVKQISDLLVARESTETLIIPICRPDGSRSAAELGVGTASDLTMVTIGGPERSALDCGAFVNELRSRLSELRE